MSKDFGFLIKKDGKYIPFKFYTKKWDNGNSVAYYYLNKEEEREKLDNRWKVLYHCGKKFIANEDSENQVEATPNDIVVVPYTLSWKAILLLCMSGFIACIMDYIYEYCNTNNASIWSSLQVGLVISGIFMVFAFFGWIKQLENKSEAKRWNEEKIPEEKLVINDFKKYDLVIEDSMEELISVTNQAVSLGYIPKGGMICIKEKFIQPIYLKNN